MPRNKYTSSSLTSTKQFVWCGNERCESRDGSSTILGQFFPRGELLSSAKYFYDKDQLGSVREVIDNSGNPQSVYVYDPFGRVTKDYGSGRS